MNDNIERIKKLRQQIAYLDLLLSKGGHVAAGLSIGLQVGAKRDDYEYAMECECSWFSGDILQTMRNSLAQSLEHRIKAAHKELADLTEFLNQQ